MSTAVDIREYKERGGAMRAHKSFRQRVGDISFKLFGEITGYIRMAYAAVILALAFVGLLIWLNWGFLVTVTSSGIGTIVVLAVGGIIFVAAMSVIFFALGTLTEAIQEWAERGMRREWARDFALRHETPEDEAP